VVGQGEAQRDQPVRLGGPQRPVEIFRVPAADQRIHHGRARQGEHTRGGTLVQADRLDVVGGSEIPVARRRERSTPIVPGQRYRRLRRCAGVGQSPDFGEVSQKRR
jgi:hypothetical protein